MGIELDNTKIYNDKPLHHLAKEGKDAYPSNIMWCIQIMYLISLIIWIVFCYLMGFFKLGWLGWVIALIPVLVFAVNYVGSGICGREVEGEMFTGSFLSFAVVSAVILVNWGKGDNVDKSKFFGFLILSIALVGLSSIDFWVPRDKMIVVKHFRSILQTFALTILALTLYMYYGHRILLNANETGDVSAVAAI